MVVLLSSRTQLLNLRKHICPLGIALQNLKQCWIMLQDAPVICFTSYRFPHCVGRVQCFFSFEQWQMGYIIPRQPTFSITILGLHNKRRGNKTEWLLLASFCRDVRTRASRLHNLKQSGVTSKENGEVCTRKRKGSKVYSDTLASADNTGQSKQKCCTCLHTCSFSQSHWHMVHLKTTDACISVASQYCCCSSHSQCSGRVASIGLTLNNVTCTKKKLSLATSRPKMCKQ